MQIVVMSIHPQPDLRFRHHPQRDLAAKTTRREPPSTTATHAPLNALRPALPARQLRGGDGRVGIRRRSGVVGSSSAIPAPEVLSDLTTLFRRLYQMRVSPGRIDRPALDSLSFLAKGRQPFLNSEKASGAASLPHKSTRIPHQRIDRMKRPTPAPDSVTSQIKSWAISAASSGLGVIP